MCRVSEAECSHEVRERTMPPMSARDGLFRNLPFPQQLRQLRDVRSNAPRLVLSEWLPKLIWVNKRVRAG